MPVITGVVSLVISEVTVGAAGAVLSMVMGSAVLPLMFPAGSVALIASAIGPSVRGVAGVAVQVPSA